MWGGGRLPWKTLKNLSWETCWQSLWEISLGHLLEISCWKTFSGHFLGKLSCECPAETLLENSLGEYIGKLSWKALLEISLELSWETLLQISRGNLSWDIIFGIPLIDMFCYLEKSPLDTSLGRLSWNCLLEISLGKRSWKMLGDLTWNRSWFRTTTRLPKIKVPGGKDKIKRRRPTFPRKNSMTDTACTHARAKRNEFPITRGPSSHSLPQPLIFR